MRRMGATFRQAGLALALTAGLFGWSCNVPDYDFPTKPDAGDDAGAPVGPTGPVTCTAVLDGFAG
jgi:hypothetical protein